MTERMQNIDDLVKKHHDRTLAAGGVDVSQEALVVALDFIRSEKEKAIDTADDLAVQSWVWNERNIMYALGGLGLSPAREQS